jgi:AcrR family transcriptional regulator
MRIRTEGRRQAILAAARELFCEVGFERTSMAQISARAGGSKATLYSYFPSKEELFAEAMVGAMMAQAEQLNALLDPSDPDLRRVLSNFGFAFMEMMESSQCRDTIRTVIAVSGEGDLGPKLFEMGPKHGWMKAGEYIASLMGRGLLRQADPMVAALHLKGLFEVAVLVPRLFGAPPQIERDVAVREGVDAFLRAYRPD